MAMVDMAVLTGTPFVALWTYPKDSSALAVGRFSGVYMCLGGYCRGQKGKPQTLNPKP